MQEAPLISIIIPYYNAERYLERCLKSIAGQSYGNLEIITVDDGSEDKSFEIAEGFANADPRIKPLKAAHGGVSAARNFGIKNASGELVMFADADDWMNPEAVKQMLDAMIETDADIVTCNILRVSDSSEEATWEDGYTVCTRDEYMRVFFRIGGNEIVHFPVAKLYRRRLLTDDLYPDGIRIGEDMVGTYRAIRDAEKIVRLNGIGYYYFFTEDSATDIFGDKDFDLITVWDKVVEDSEGREPDHSYAVLNRKRINFGLLMRMTLEVPAKERKANYPEETAQLRSDLKACYKDLMDAPIVKSRKFMIFMTDHCYPLVSFAGNIYNGLAKKPAVGNRSKLS